LTEKTHSNYNNIDLRYIKQTRLNTHVTILIVDEKVSIVMEIRDDSKGTFDEAIGLSIYSNSRAGVLSYISIFENLWLQTELYDQISESNMRLEQANEQLIAHDKMQKEFINIAAHELKTLLYLHTAFLALVRATCSSVPVSIPPPTSTS
jgi:hypothetical protein